MRLNPQQFCCSQNRSLAILIEILLTYTIKNDDIPIKYNFTLPLINEYENDTVVNIAVKLSKAPKAPLTVKYSLDNDPTKTTAILNSDFSFIDNTGLLTFAAGETVKEIGIKLIDDTIPWRMCSLL